ncbi:MAG TPA: MFS transporter [Thermoplasmata archaeon]|jgi:MFS family permease|nr:MFS transporter [Thermoplasmata archaeon]HYB78818.1 MFS transporter [Thermoplasmata archaeon]
MNANGRGLTAAGTPYDPRAARGALLVLAVMAMMVTYVETMVLPAFHNFITFFDNAPTTTVVWIVSAYLLIGTVATPIFGKLGDKYGKKRMLLFVMGLYAVAVSVAGFTPNIGAAFGVSRANQIYVLIGVRAFQGLGMGMFPLAFAILPEVFPAARVGQAQGIVSGMFAAGAAAGLVGGGYISYNYGWQLTYHTVTPIAITLVVLAYFLLRESPHLSPKPIDVPGIGSLGFALAMAMFGITEGVYWGWTSFSAVSFAGIPWGVPEFFLLALAAAVFFLFWETRAPTPVVSFQALKQRNIWISNVNGVIVGIGMFLIFVTLTILVEDPFPPGFNYTEFQFGLVALPSALGMLAFGPLWGRLVAARGPKPVMILGFVVMGSGALGLALFHSTILALTLFAIPALVGNVAVLIAMSNIIVLSVSPKELGIQTGMNQTFRNLGSAVGPVLAATITATFTTQVVVATTPFGRIFASVPATTGFVVLFAITAGVALVGLVLSLGLRNYRFHADGTRLEAPSALRGPAASASTGENTPALSAADRPA